MRDRDCAGQVRPVLHQYRELVAAQPDHQVALAHTVAHPGGHGHEQLVAGGMAEAVVDELEVVQVEEQHDRQPAHLVVGEHLFHALGQETAIGQPGKRVVIGLVAQLLLEPGQLGQRLLELAVLERDCRLVGQCLQQSQILGQEGRAFG